MMNKESSIANKAAEEGELSDAQINEFVLELRAKAAANEEPVTAIEIARAAIAADRAARAGTSERSQALESELMMNNRHYREKFLSPSAPVGAVPSIDTPEFQNVLDEFAYCASERRALGGDFGSADKEEVAQTALVAHIDQHVASHVRAARDARQDAKPTDLSHRLRETADQQPGWKPLLIAAADEIERYYGGMMAWKQTAEKKDRDWNEGRMARENKRRAAPVSAPVVSDERDNPLYQVLTLALGSLAMHDMGEAAKIGAQARAALANQPAPTAAQPELEVWYGAMPESNGKSNFTAILKRKGAGPFDTCHITIDQSEYPDRVRYEADRVRWLIGDLAEEPFILDYDADKHSGYVKPAPTAAPEHDLDVFKYAADRAKADMAGTVAMLNSKLYAAAPEQDNG